MITVPGRFFFSGGFPLSLTTYTRPPKSGQKPKSMVIFLHGLGSNGEDLIDIADYWADALPDTVFLSPDAPFRCDMAPMGFQWFSLQSWSPDSVLQGVQRAAPILQSYINDALQKYDLPDEKLALVGFSQGTMMSLYAGPRREKRIAGIVGYSGALIGGETLGDLHIHKVPIHLIHGDMDMIVPVGMYHMAHHLLESNGFPLSGGITRGLQHTIDQGGLKDGAEFLKRVLA